MIRCALAEIRSELVSIERRLSSSSSSVSTLGSITTPLPITHSLPRCRIPDGIRWSFQVLPLRTIVCPALLPPWKRTTASARSASRSVILPFPSSPHWAPTITSPGIGRLSVGVSSGVEHANRGPPRLPPNIRPAPSRQPQIHPPVLSEQRQLVAHLSQPRHRALADLLAEGFAVQDVGGDHHRTLVLVAGVDHRVELLQNPIRRPLCADVIDVKQVDSR